MAALPESGGALDQCALTMQTLALVRGEIDAELADRVKRNGST